MGLLLLELFWVWFLLSVDCYFVGLLIGWFTCFDCDSWGCALRGCLLGAAVFILCPGIGWLDCIWLQ